MDPRRLEFLEDEAGPDAAAAAYFQGNKPRRQRHHLPQAADLQPLLQNPEGIINCQAFGPV
jgi:hypothetical protein